MRLARIVCTRRIGIVIISHRYSRNLTSQARARIFTTRMFPCRRIFDKRFCGLTFNNRAYVDRYLYVEYLGFLIHIAIAFNLIRVYAHYSLKIIAFLFYIRFTT